MQLQVILPVDCFVVSTLSTRDNEAGYVVLNDPLRPESEAEPALLQSVKFQKVYFNITLGALSGQSTASQGCSSVVKYDLPTVQAVCSKYGIHRRRRPSPSVCRDVAHDLGIPTKFGAEPFRLLLQRTLKYIDDRSTDQTAGPVLTTHGHKRIIDAVVEELAKSGTWDYRLPPTTGVAPKDLSAPSTLAPGSLPTSSRITAIREECLGRVAGNATVQDDLAGSKISHVELGADVKHLAGDLNDTREEIVADLHLLARDLGDKRQEAQLSYEEIVADLDHLAGDLNVTRDSYSDVVKRVDQVDERMDKSEMSVRLFSWALIDPDNKESLAYRVEALEQGNREDTWCSLSEDFGSGL